MGRRRSEISAAIHSLHQAHALSGECDYAALGMEGHLFRTNNRARMLRIVLATLTLLAWYATSPAFDARTQIP